MPQILAYFCLTLLLGLVGCSSNYMPTPPGPPSNQVLTPADVNTLVTQAVESAVRMNQNAVIAVVDRMGNILAVYTMSNTAGSVWDVNVGAVPKARTAAYLSSNQHGFTTLTACYLTRAHFPPGVPNTPGAPLYGVIFSSQSGGDVMPSQPGQPATPTQGLTGIPGGQPVYKNGVLVGGLGVSTFGTVGRLPATFLIDCGGPTSIPDETISLGATIGYATPNNIRGDLVFIVGNRLPYQIAPTPAGNFVFGPADLAARGSFMQGYPVANPIGMPAQGPVVLTNSTQNYTVRAGQFLSAAEVQQIINQAVARASNTRAAIRQPLNSAARMFISVVDVDGSVLGVWRMPDATLFSYDVSVQKARTVVAFSDPTNPLGAMIRQKLGLPSTQQLAVTTRMLGYVSQRYFPPGIDAPNDGSQVQQGPLFVPDPTLGLNDFRWQQNLGLMPFGNGITLFPGGIPLYKNGQLAGGLGASGDSPDGDDYAAAGGAVGYEAPTQIRGDQFFYQNVRLPYLKFPRNPDLN